MRHMIDGILMCGNSKPKEEEEETLPVDEASDEVSSAADVHDPEKYREVFRARHRLSKLMEVLCEVLFSAVLMLLRLLVSVKSK